MIELLDAVRLVAFAVGMAFVIIPPLAVVSGERWIGDIEELYGTLIIGFILLGWIFQPW